MERARMERVFANLFENAIEGMRSGGSISIRAEAESDDILVRVEDSGPGISALQGQLFQPFVSAGKKNGLGLGPALPRQTLLGHGGDIWADEASGREDGDAPGREDGGEPGPENAGAIFWLRLPKNRSGVTHEPAVMNGSG